MNDEVETRPDGLFVDGVNFSRLYKAIEHSYESIEWFRKQTHKLVAKYAGPAYGAKGGPDRPVNKIFQQVDAYLMLTAANRPAADVCCAEHPEFADHYERSLNSLGEDIDLKGTTYQWSLSAFFGIGVVKRHRGASDPIEIAGELIDTGTPTASVVPIDDWVFDTGAKEWPQIKYCGDKYRIPFRLLEEWVKAGKADAAVVAKLQPTSKQGQESDRLDKISTGEITDDDELEPMIDLSDVWVAQTNKIYTCAIQDPNRFTHKELPPVASMDWDETIKGRPLPNHHLLRYSLVPHNILPIPPAVHIEALDRAANNVVNKEIDRAVNQKENPLYTAAGEKAASNIKRAGDNEWVLVNDIKEIGLHKSGGIDQNMHQAGLAFLELCDIMGGNLPALTGTGSSAETLGQEQLIHNSSNKKVGSLQATVAEAAGELFSGLGRMLWNDKFRRVGYSRNVAGYNLALAWEPDDREGTPNQYDVSVDVISLPHTPPAARAELLMSLIERVYIPAAPMIAAQGIQIDYVALTKELSDLLPLNGALEQVVKWSSPVELPGEEGGGMSPSTTRNYTRTSVPSQGTPQSRLAATLSGMQQATNQQPGAAV